MAAQAPVLQVAPKPWTWFYVAWALALVGSVITFVVVLFGGVIFSASVGSRTSWDAPGTGNNPCTITNLVTNTRVCANPADDLTLAPYWEY